MLQLAKEADVIKKLENIIIEELNVKKVEFLQSEENILQFSAKLNFPVLGPIFGKNIHQVQKQIQTLTSKEIFAIYQGKDYCLSVNDEKHFITKKDLIFTKTSKDNLLIEANEKFTVILDTTINEDLKIEGLSRDLVHWIQQKRKNLGLEITDRICIKYHPNDIIQQIFANHKEYIQEEVLCKELVPTKSNTSKIDELDLENYKIFLAIEKI